MRSFLILTTAALGLMAAPAMAAPKDCPPGLAKKAVPCVPPGLAKKDPDYRIGDRIAGRYDRLRRPGDYGLDRDGTYYRVGDYLYRVNPQTKEVLDLIGAVAQIIN